MKDTTLLCTFRNRTSQVLACLPSWLSHNFTEVILLDWGSAKPFQSPSAKIKLLRTQAPMWHLAEAVNFGIAQVKTKYVFKVDADVKINIPPLPLQLGTFRTGRWQTHMVGQTHCNGSFHIETESFQLIQGYDRLIRSYGWEDEDLYLRLQCAGLKRRYFLPNQLTHCDHDDKARASQDPTKLIERNKATCQLRRRVSHAKHYM